MHFRTCAWVRLHVYVSILVCVAVRRGLFSWGKKATHCPRAVLDLQSGPLRSESRPAWLELCVSAR